MVTTMLVKVEGGDKWGR